MNTDSDTTSPTSPISSRTSRHSVATSDYFADAGSTGEPGSSKPKGKAEKKGKGLFRQLKGWVSTSEPSAQAFKQHKKDTFQKAGVSTKDPSANAKLRAPLGDIPEDAIHAKGKGLDPEEVALQRARQRQQLRQSYSHLHGATRDSRSFSSSMSASSVRDSANDAAYPDFDKPASAG